MFEYYDAIATLADIPRLHAEKNPDKTALIANDERFTYRDLNLRSNQVAQGLLGLDSKPGARVAMLGFDSEKSYELLFGCAKSNRVLVNINWRLEADEIAYILTDSETETLFISPELVEPLQPLLEQLPNHTVILLADRGEHFPNYVDWRKQQSEAAPELAIEPSHPVVQIYTSGTSGRPKGVLLAHYCFLDLIRAVERAGDEWVDWQPGDTSLLALPSFHIGGLWWAVHGLINAAKNVVMKAFIAWQALEFIEKYRINKLAFAPAMIRFLLSEPNCGAVDLSSVDTVVYGGSPMPRPILEKGQLLFQCGFTQNYGLSETTNMACTLSRDEHTNLSNPRLCSVGKPLRGVQVKVVDTAGNELPVGETGEICLRTPVNMLEYWRRPEETHSTLVDGWVYTGDAGFVDVDGYVYITDRVKDLIICAGENIYPAEIERVLIEHLDIEDIALVGIPDDRWGEVPLAFVVKRESADLSKADVIKYARTRLAAHKLPRAVEFIGNIPRNASGKILKRILREPYWQGRERRVN